MLFVLLVLVLVAVSTHDTQLLQALPGGYHDFRDAKPVATVLPNQSSDNNEDFVIKSWFATPAMEQRLLSDAVSLRAWQQQQRNTHHHHHLQEPGWMCSVLRACVPQLLLRLLSRDCLLQSPPPPAPLNQQVASNRASTLKAKPCSLPAAYLLPLCCATATSPRWDTWSGT